MPAAVQKRPFLFASLAAVVLVVMLELASYAFIVLAGKNYYLPLALKDLSEDSIPSAVKDRFSQDLGWEPGHLNDHGYRGPEKPLENALLAVFGDGYAQGSRVLEDSWPYLLEQKVGLPVLNFGVGAYGPDQAYLRFEERYVDQINTPYTALIMMSGGMARVVNRYRGFYARGRDIRYPKPMFKTAPDGDIELLPNPLTSPADLVKLSDPTFLEEIGEGDFWYAKFDGYGLNEFVDFPYAYHLIKAAPYYWQRWRNHRTTDQQSYQALYEHEDARSTLHAIIERFIARSREQGATPVFVLLPNRADLGQYLEQGTTSYGDVLSDLRTIDHPHIYDGLDFYLPAIEQGAGLDDFFVSKDNDQLSTMAEQLVSDAMHDVLESADAEHGHLQRD